MPRKREADDSAPATEGRHPGGRPTDYREKFCKTAHDLCQAGATDVEVADELGVNPSTLYRWMAKHPEFRESMQLGKDGPDLRVVRSLYNRAVGYTFDSIKIMQHEGEPVIVPYREHVPPDVVAATRWLHNRRSDDWKDRQIIEHSADSAFVELLKQMGKSK